MKKLILSATILLGAVLASQAGVHVSVGIGLPLPGIVVSAPAPVVCAAPAPVVYAPAPAPVVYAAPAPVVYRPAVVYAAPPPVVYAPAPAVVVAPSLYVGWGWHGGRYYCGPGYGHGWRR